jgi:hypothetical protein
MGLVPPFLTKEKVYNLYSMETELVGLELELPLLDMLKLTKTNEIISLMGPDPLHFH